MKILILIFFFEIKESKITRGHNYKLVKKQSRLDVRKYSFPQRTINVWNNLSYVAEYCAPIWRNSTHTNFVDVQLNNTMSTITGSVTSVRCTRTDWLPVLGNIAPAYIRREVATFRMFLSARGKPELPLLTDIDFHPTTTANETSDMV